MADHLVAALTGETVSALRLGKDAQDAEYIAFLLASGKEHIFMLDADCCSETWMYAIQNVQALFNRVIQEVIPCPETALDDDGKSRQQYDKLYRYTLATSRGYVDLEFRNSSNGYYGGGLYPYRPHELPTVIRWTNIDADYLAS